MRRWSKPSSSHRSTVTDSVSRHSQENVFTLGGTGRKSGVAFSRLRRNITGPLGGRCQSSPLSPFSLWPPSVNLPPRPVNHGLPTILWRFEEESSGWVFNVYIVPDGFCVVTRRRFDISSATSFQFRETLSHPPLFSQGKLPFSCEDLQGFW